MSTDKFRKKPVVIEAFQLPPAGDSDAEPFLAWAEKVGFENWNSARDEGLDIETLEGVMRADPGDWVIKGVKGEFYPCKPDIFAATYEPADSSPRYQFDAPALNIAQKIMECRATAAVDGWPDDRLKAAIQCLVIEAMKWAAPASPDADQEDAARWRALIGSARIRILGSAGFQQVDDPRWRSHPDYRHFGMEIWTHHPEWPAEKNEYGIEILTQYADQMRKLQAAAPAPGGEHG